MANPAIAGQTPNSNKYSHKQKHTHIRPSGASASVNSTAATLKQPFFKVNSSTHPVIAKQRAKPETASTAALVTFKHNSRTERIVAAQNQRHDHALWPAR
jgi:hypothetical protein